jgi:hypothetical protein
LMASAGVDNIDQRNRKLGAVLLGVILALIAIAIIGVITLN